MKRFFLRPTRQNTMAARLGACAAFLRLTGVLYAVIFNGHLFGNDTSCLPACTKVFGISGETALYIDNIEYSTRYRTGETMFGASAACRFFWKPSEHMRFAAGVFCLRRFGDERFLARSLPLFCAQYESDRVLFVIGELFSSDAHQLPDLLYRQEYSFDPGIEEGIQMRLRMRHFSQELWVAWDSLNTPSHREHFTAGSVSIISVADFSFPVFITAEHHGGELYDIPGQPVQERFGGAAGVSASHRVQSGLNRVFGQLLITGSVYRVRSEVQGTGRGYGIISKAGVSPLGFDCSLQLFKGNNLVMPLGDPVFRSNQPFFSLEIAKTYVSNDLLSATGGIRFETVNTGNFSNPRYRFWVIVRGGFNHIF
jgi:hypothetical protein